MLRVELPEGSLMVRLKYDFGMNQADGATIGEQKVRMMNEDQIQESIRIHELAMRTGSDPIMIRNTLSTVREIMRPISANDKTLHCDVLAVLDTLIRQSKCGGQ